MGWGIIYLSLHCHNQNESFIKMGSDESYFNVLLIVRDKVTRQCPQTTTFGEREREDPVISLAKAIPPQNNVFVQSLFVV